MIRPNKIEYFMSLALLAAQRASCPRRKVGCILVDANSYVVSTGYNGPPSGTPNCTDTPCGGQNQPSGQGLSLCKAIHAEINAYTQAGDRLVTVTDMFLTAGPCCPLCTETTEQLIQSGKLAKLKRIYFFDHYPTDTAKVFESYGIELIHVDQHLDSKGVLSQLAVLLGFRQAPRPRNQVLCVGGALHGCVVTCEGNYMQADPSQCTPEELKRLYRVGDYDRIPAKAVINTQRYYRESYQSNNRRIDVMRYEYLTDAIFKRLLYSLINDNLAEFM